MDLHTLHMEHAVLLGLFTVLTLVNCRLHRGVRGMYWFPVYNLCALIGAVLILLRGQVSEPVSIIFGMTFFHLAYLCLHRSLTDFYSRRDLRWPMYVQVTAVGVSFMAMLEYGFVHPNTRARLVVYSLIFALQLWLTARLVFQNARGNLRVPSLLMGYILALLCFNNVIRGVSTVITGAPANYLQGGPALQWALVWTTVLQGGITVAFVWMTAAALHQNLMTLATTDPLTGLLNRRAMEQAARQEVALSLQTARPMSAILVDLDQFKAINDTYGHPFGDTTLVEVAKCLQSNMRSTDLLGRIGGDEFAIVLRNTDEVAAKAIVDRLRGSVASLLVVNGVHKTRVSASIGLAHVNSSIQNWDDLVVHCDRALYAMKAADRGYAVNN